MGKHKKKALGRGLASLIEEEATQDDVSTAPDGTAEQDHAAEEATDAPAQERSDEGNTATKAESAAETSEENGGSASDETSDALHSDEVPTDSGDTSRARAAFPAGTRPVGRAEDGIARQVDIRIARDWASREDSLVHYSKRHDESTELTVTIPRLLLFTSGAPLVALSLVGVLGICRSFVRSGRK